MNLAGVGVDFGAVSSVVPAVLLMASTLDEHGAGNADVVGDVLRIGEATNPAILEAFGQAMSGKSSEMSAHGSRLNAENLGQCRGRERFFAEKREDASGAEAETTSPPPHIRGGDATATVMSHNTGVGKTVAVASYRIE